MVEFGKENSMNAIVTPISHDLQSVRISIEASHNQFPKHQVYPKPKRIHQNGHRINNRKGYSKRDNAGAGNNSFHRHRGPPPGAHYPPNFYQQPPRPTLNPYYAVNNPYEALPLFDTAETNVVDTFSPYSFEVTPQDHSITDRTNRSIHKLFQSVRLDPGLCMHLQHVSMTCAHYLQLQCKNVEDFYEAKRLYEIEQAELRKDRESHNTTDNSSSNSGSSRSPSGSTVESSDCSVSSSGTC